MLFLCTQYIYISDTYKSDPYEPSFTHINIYKYIHVHTYVSLHKQMKLPDNVDKYLIFMYIYLYKLPS